MSSSSVMIGQLKLFGNLRDNEERVKLNGLSYIIATWTLEEWERLKAKPIDAQRVGNVMVQLTAE